MSHYGDVAIPLDEKVLVDIFSCHPMESVIFVTKNSTFSFDAAWWWRPHSSMTCLGTSGRAPITVLSYDVYVHWWARSSICSEVIEGSGHTTSASYRNRHHKITKWNRDGTGVNEDTERRTSVAVVAQWAVVLYVQ